jgi:hypothetical protein
MLASPGVPQRTVHHGDGIAWLGNAELGPEHAIVTSLPDVSELPALDLDAWQDWIVSTTTLIIQRTHPASVAMFYQTDIKRDGRLIDKGYLVQRAADAAGAACLFHKIVCRAPPGETTFGRPAFGHWLAFSQDKRVSPGDATPDVLPELGTMTWSRAMPMTACVATCRFLQKHTACRVVVDPFCGRGTMLAVANDHGFDAIGVELSRKRARKARTLQL